MIKKRKSSHNEFYYTIHAKNGQVIATSEYYHSEVALDNAIELLCKVMNCIVSPEIKQIDEN